MKVFSLKVSSVPEINAIKTSFDTTWVRLTKTLWPAVRDDPCMYLRHTPFTKFNRATAVRK
jgi:hypothetical protein